MNAKGVAKGVEEAMGYWLYDHPISAPDCIIEGVRVAFRDWLNDDAETFVTNAVTKWLDDHHEEIVKAIADRKKGD